MTTPIQAIDTTINGLLQIKTKPNYKVTNGVVDTVTTIWGTAKGVVDLFGILAKSAELAGSMVSKEVASWTSQVGKTFSHARNALSLPYLPTVLKNFTKDPSVRNGMEVGKIGGYATALFVTDAAIANKIAKSGGAAAVVLDVIDLSQELNMHRACANLSGVQMNAEVRQVVDSQLWNSALRIAKLVLTLFAGITATGAWILGMAIPASLATAALIASLAALAISFSLTYSDNTTEWTAKISLLPVQTPA
jgi:hypothetical protein